MEQKVYQTLQLLITRLQVWTPCSYVWRGVSTLTIPMGRESPKFCGWWTPKAFPPL